MILMKLNLRSLKEDVAKIESEFSDHGRPVSFDNPSQFDSQFDGLSNEINKFCDTYLLSRGKGFVVYKRLMKKFYCSTTRVCSHTYKANEELLIKIITKEYIAKQDQRPALVT